MAPHRTFRAFFSYAHVDAAADPSLFKSLAKDLEDRVNVKFANDRFEIWRDTEGLRLGDKWKPKIEEAIRASDILLVLLTPRWLGSPNCLKEYSIFEEVEAARGTSDFSPGYVATILVRSVEKEVENLTPMQINCFNSLKERQYQRLVAEQFLSFPKTKRIKIIDQIADDICGIVERRRTTSPQSKTNEIGVRQRSTSKPEFDLRAFNYDEVDFVSNAEVILDRQKVGQYAVYAQIDFIRRLYVQAEHGRVEFGVRRAYLQIANEGPGDLTKVQELKGGAKEGAIYGIPPNAPPNTIGVFIDAPLDRSSLAEIAIPPIGPDNYLSKVAAASDEVEANWLQAELRVSLNTEGLFLGNTGRRILSSRAELSIKAIINAVMAKVADSKEQTFEGTNRLRRKLRVISRA
jgi:hypothetical protein